MRALTISLVLGLLSLAPPALAEAPLALGFKKAAAAFQSIPTEIANQAVEAASAHFSPYLRPYGQNYSISPLHGTRPWIEVQGLGFDKLRHDALSEADLANGIEARLILSVDADCHRPLEKSSSWGPWQTGPTLFIPRVVYVEKTNGHWSARSTIGTYARAVSDGSIQLSLKTPPTPPPALAEPPIVSRPQAARPSPPTKARPSTAAPPSRSISRAFLAALVPLFLILFGILAIALLVHLFRRRSSALPTRNVVPTPPVWASAPPPLPGKAPANPAAYQARTHLHTPTEQSFRRVLESLLPPSCAICGNVRLADLFETRPGSGHQAAFNRIVGKHLDFVIIDRLSTRILGAIELDDASHQRADRQKRDDFLNALFQKSPLPLIRIPVARMDDTGLLRQSLSQLIESTSAA